MTKKKKILVIDDERDLTEEISHCLKNNGYEVLASDDGREGLKKARSEKPDLILLDIFMSEMSGSQVSHNLKKDPATRSIPIIMLTAITREKDKTGSKENGADEYITKPFETGEMIAKINTLLKQKQ